MNRFSVWRAGMTTLFFRTGPPGYIGWRNRFLFSLNVYKYGLCTVFCCPVLPCTVVHSFALSGAVLDSSLMHCNVRCLPALSCAVFVMSLSYVELHCFVLHSYEESCIVLDHLPSLYCTVLHSFALLSQTVWVDLHYSVLTCTVSYWHVLSYVDLHYIFLHSYAESYAVLDYSVLTSPLLNCPTQFCLAIRCSGLFCIVLHCHAKSPKFCTVTRCPWLFCIVLHCQQSSALSHCPQSSALSHAVLCYSALSCTVPRVLHCHTMFWTVLLVCTVPRVLQCHTMSWTILHCSHFPEFCAVTHCPVGTILHCPAMFPEFCTVLRCPGLFCIVLHSPHSSSL